MKASHLALNPAPRPESRGALFAGLFGLLLGVGLMKFGNPVILDRLVGTPHGLEEWRAFAWPVRYGQVALLGVLLVGCLVPRGDWRPRAPVWVLVLLAGWLGWQFVATPASLDPAATRAVLLHFVCCGACFLLGDLVLSRVAEPRVFWICLVAGFVGALGMACDQRFGGLEATRKMILEGPEAASLSPEYLARIQSNRVFGTLVYPNALAGAVLLLLPLSSVVVWRGTFDRWGAGVARAAVAGIVGPGVGVLVWTGSKAGWLLAMGVVVFLLFHSPLSRPFKVGFAALVLVGGLVGFGVVFREKLSRGATSVSARMDYWSAAWKGFVARPVFGNGPGAFKRVYAQVKRPESEMAQLAHNDFLQQAVDTGFPGCLAYSAFVFGSLTLLYRDRRVIRSPLARAVWLGLAAWFAQGLVEFGLYIPATAWVAFALLGWLLAQKPLRPAI